MLLSFRCSDYFVRVLCHVYHKGPHHIHSLRSSCFTKTSAFNVAGNLVMVVKFTFQSVFGNSLQNPRHFSARGREESLELYSILWSDRPTSKQKVLRHGNRLAARVRRRYFSEGEKRRPEMRLLFAGYPDLGSASNWPFAQWRHFTTTTRILFVFHFIFTFGNPMRLKQQKC